MTTIGILEKAALACAMLAGVLLTGITLMTCTSLVGRNTTGDSIIGAFELTAIASGAAIAMFMPICQLRRGNIVVDFFTTGLKPGAIDVLDRIGAAVVAAVFALLAWRSSIGGLSSYHAGSQTQIMGFPEWVVYIFMVPAFAITAIIAMHQCVYGFGVEDQAEAAAV